MGTLPVGRGASRTGVVTEAADRHGRGGCADGSADGRWRGGRQQRRPQRRRGAGAGRRGGFRLGASSGLRLHARRARLERARPSATGGRALASSASSVASMTPRVDRGVFFASLNASLQRSRDAAVLADAPEVDREEDHQHERQRKHVQHVPAQAACSVPPRRRPAAGSSPAWR